MREKEKEVVERYGHVFVDALGRYANCVMGGGEGKLLLCRDVESGEYLVVDGEYVRYVWLGGGKEQVRLVVQLSAAECRQMVERWQLRLVE